MKKLNKKGFTIVELVIVIAVIAILAGVLIPTFATVVERANKSKAMQQARIAYENYLAENADNPEMHKYLCIEAGGYFFYVDNGQFNSTANTKHVTAGTNGTATDKSYVHVNVADKAEKFSTDSNGKLVTTAPAAN